MSDPHPPSPSNLPSSWKSEEEDAVRTDAKGNRLWIVLVGLVLVLVVAAVAFVVGGGGAEERAWPSSTNGRPAGLGGEKETAADVAPEAPAGVYIWNSFDGWHLWVLNGDERAGLSGTITSSDDLVSAVSSAPDAGTVAVDGKEITFAFDGEADVAGVDFDPGFSKKLTFTLERDGKAVAASEVTTGQDGAPVDAVPVVIDKPVVD